MTDTSTHQNSSQAPVVRIRVGVDEQPAHLRTAGQLLLAGRRLLPGQQPAGWLERVIAGDVWTTALYDLDEASTDGIPVPAQPPTPNDIEAAVQEAPAVEMCAVTWVRHKTWNGVETAQPTRVHITLDGEYTRCGNSIPEGAELTPVELSDWHLRTDCYNCAYRLWPEYGPTDYIRPANGDDFPPRRVPRSLLADAPWKHGPLSI